MRPDDDPGPVVGQTGARFGGPGRRRARRANPDAAPPDAAPPEARPEPPAMGLTGARFGGSVRRRRDIPAAAAEPAPPPVPAPEPDPPPVPSEVAEPLESDPSLSSFVRPYVLTSGRTRAPLDLALETLVSARRAVAHVPWPHRDVLDLCLRTRSVAEVAALRGVPLGVARVLLGDLVAAGAVVVHRTAGADGPDLALLQRVLSGLHRL